MAIPLDLSIRIHAAGLELFSGVQNAIVGTSEAARTKAAANLSRLASTFQTVASSTGLVTPELQSLIGGMATLSRYAGLITPASLDMFADSLSAVRQSLIESSLAYEILSSHGATMQQIISSMAPEEQRLATAIGSVVDGLRNQATAMQMTTHHTVQAEKATTRATAATRLFGRQARMSAFTGMNVLSSATQGVMMAMGAMQGNLMSLGFGLIFLRYSIAPVTLGVAALITAIGGTMKAIGFVGPAFEKLVAGPMNRIKAAMVEALGYFSGAVWVRIIAPSLRIIADLAERFRDLALQTWLSAEVQRAWGELLTMVQGTFVNLNRTIKEHGGILKWVVRTGFIAAINVLKGLIDLINIAITVLPQLAYLWRSLSGDLKRVWSVLGLVAGAFKTLGLDDILEKVKEWALNVSLEDILLLSVGVLTGGPKGLLLAAAASLLGDLLADFLGFDTELRDKWKTLWNWVAIGAFVGFAIGHPEIGIALGLVLGAFAAFQTEVTTIAYEIRISMERALLAVSEFFIGFDEWLVRLGLEQQETLDLQKRRIADWKADIEAYDIWAGLGKPSLEPYLAQQEMTFREWLRTLQIEAGQIKLFTPERLGGGGVLTGFAARWATMREGAVTRPYPGVWGASGALGVPGGIVINVTVTGNNMYGKLDDETARVWAGQIGYALSARLTTRKGFPLR